MARSGRRGSRRRGRSRRRVAAILPPLEATRRPLGAAGTVGPVCAVGPVGAAFPGVVVDGEIDRAALAAQVLDCPDAMKRLEGIVHPLVWASRRDFDAACAARGESFVVYDIPLLFETGAQDMVDAIVVVSAPADVQKARVLARPGMTEEKFAALLARQVPDAEKRRQADFVVETDAGPDAARARVRDILDCLRAGAFRRKEI